MLRIKRLYLYILQTFVPVFFMTFAISLFIILMQFVWKYVEDLVGKGLEPHVMAELFAYAALIFVPMALPLAILLASLMTFGNLGERYELLAIKAAGISLLRAMKPLIVLILLISIGIFFFQNDISPQVQVKFRSLMISIKQKSPELEIPEGTFYSDIENYNLYVKSKDKETGTLRDVMIYDVSKGFDNMAVIVCDSAKLKMSSNKDYLMLDLYHGQQFANFQQAGMNSGGYNNKFVPYSRENFKEKQVVIPFDANFKRIDESSMEGTQIAKNISQLKMSIDSLSLVVDSLNINDRRFMLDYSYLSYRTVSTMDTVNKSQSRASVASYDIDMDSVVNTLTASEKISLYSDALTRAENNKNDFMFRSISKVDTQKKIRYHDIELQKKFALSFACLVFFFIGAPLGAIIRKGGLGMPVVISVILFIIYYVIDNVGSKMARDGVLEVWQGVWLSSFILFPLGVFLTYKAMNDSALFNADAYRNFLNRVFGVKDLNRDNYIDEHSWKVSVASNMLASYIKCARVIQFTFVCIFAILILTVFYGYTDVLTVFVLVLLIILYCILLLGLLSFYNDFHDALGRKSGKHGIIIIKFFDIPFLEYIAMILSVVLSVVLSTFLSAALSFYNIKKMKQGLSEFQNKTI